MLDNNVSLKELIDAFELVDNDLVDRGLAQTITPSTSNKILLKGNYRGDITVKGDANLISANILSGKSIFGVEGTLEKGKKTASGTYLSSSEIVVPGGWGDKDIATIQMNLSFTPSRIILFIKDSLSQTVQYPNGDGPVDGNWSLDSNYNYSRGTAANNAAQYYGDRGWYYIRGITSSSFKLAAFINTSSTSVKIIGPIHWFAIE